MASLKGSSHLRTQVPKLDKIEKLAKIEEKIELLPDRMSQSRAKLSYPQDRNLVGSIQVKSNIPAPRLNPAPMSCLTPVDKSKRVKLGMP